MTTPTRYEAPAIIIGLDSLQGLQVSRIFRARDVPVIGIAKDRRHYAVHTKSVASIHYCNTANEDLVELLEALGPTLPARAVLVPCQDKNVLVISEFRDRLTDWYHIALPPHDVVLGLTNKALFYESAEGAGLSVPATYRLASLDDVERLGDSAGFPLVVKPPNRAWGWNTLTRKKAVKVSTINELSEVFKQFQDHVPVLLAQEWIEGSDGDLFTCNVYFDRSGSERASCVSQKIRQWPPRLGQGCLAVAVNDTEVATATREFYQHVGLHGFGYLEMKREPTSGRLVAIEPNVGRPTGRSAIAEAAGVELHLAMYLDAIGSALPVQESRDVPPVKWIHVLRDLQSAIYYISKRELTVAEWIRSLRGPRVFAVLSFRDPKPFLIALIRSVPVLASRRERKRSVGRG